MVTKRWYQQPPVVIHITLVQMATWPSRISPILWIYRKRPCDADTANNRSIECSVTIWVIQKVAYTRRNHGNGTFRKNQKYEGWNKIRRQTISTAKSGSCNKRKSSNIPAIMSRDIIIRPVQKVQTYLTAGNELAVQTLICQQDFGLI